MQYLYQQLTARHLALVQVLPNKEPFDVTPQVWHASRPTRPFSDLTVDVSPGTQSGSD